MSRHLRTCGLWLWLALALPGAFASAAEGLEIVRVLPGWRSADSFHRLSEYFRGRENTGGTLIFRSETRAAAGYYWLVRVRNSDGPVAGAKFVLQVITPVDPEPKTFSFPAPVAPGQSVFQLGLTGNDWPGPKSRPTAWRLSLVGADGRTLLARESFLWEMPESR